MTNAFDVEMKKKALLFRQEQGLSVTEPLPLKSLLMKLGVLTVFKPLGSDFSGMAQLEDENRFMLVNSNQSVGRQHFTVCHELYHLFVQEGFTQMVCQAGRYPKDNEVELKADLFASHLLVPEEGVLQNIPNTELSKDSIRLDTVLFIEQYFGCSRVALLRKLKAMNIISGKGYDKYKENIASGAWEHGYGSELYFPDHANTIIGDYVNVAKNLYDADLISETHYRNTLLDMGLAEPAHENQSVNEES